VGGGLVVYDLAHLIEHANAHRPAAHNAWFTYTGKNNMSVISILYYYAGLHEE